MDERAEAMKEFADTFEKIIKLTILKMMSIAIPEDWKCTRDVMITELNVPKSVQDFLLHISEAPLGNLTDFGMTRITIERAIFNTLIFRGLKGFAEDMHHTGDCTELAEELYKASKETKCGI